MKTKLFFLIAVLLALAGLEQANSQEPLPDTVWTRQLTYQQGEGLCILKFSPDGQYFYAGINNYISKYETMTGQLIYDSLMHGGQIISLDISPTGDTLLTTSVDGIIKIWNSITGEILATTPVVDEYDNKLFDANFFDNGNFIICLTMSDEKDTIPGFIIFDTKTLKKSHEFNEVTYARILRVSPTNNYFSFTVWYTPYPQIPSKDYIYLYSLYTHEKICVLGTHDNHVKDIEFSYDGKYIASGGQDGKVKIWDVEKRELVKTLNASEEVVDICFSKDNKYLFVGTGYFEHWFIYVYETINFEKIYEYQHPYGGLIDISPDSKYIISRGSYPAKPGDYHLYLYLLNTKDLNTTVSGLITNSSIIYPNPNDGIANIEIILDTTQNIKLEITDNLVPKS